MCETSIVGCVSTSLFAIGFLILTVVCNQELKSSNYRQRFYIVNSKYRMIEAIYRSANNAQEMVDCYIYGDRYVIEEALKNITMNDIVTIDEASMTKLTDFCVNAKYNEDLITDPELFFQHRHRTFAGIFIYPGTKWCGAGDAADDYDDLGPEVETDKCCRTHDHCNDSIGAYGSEHGLNNRSPVTKSHCRCDNEFQGCLKEANTRTSNRIGRIFFNILCMECFREEYPIVECLEYEGRFPYRCCQQYELDKYDDPMWQFFDSHHYEPKDEYNGLREDVMEEQEWIEEYKPMRSKELNSRQDKSL